VSSFTDYLIGIQIENLKNKIYKKRALILSLFVNLGILLVFKYYNFFIDNFKIVLEKMNLQTNPDLINIILPIGISFYTFQTLSYTIDVYNNKISAHRDIISFFAFVAFFPQLVAGPIERAKNLLPQF
jgi:D-alanyl-lipoteichoic acid acyltransferase DltB (MBOAT superfamily)